MLDRILNSARPHYADIARLCTDSRGFNLAIGAFLCTLCFAFGHPVSALAMAGAIVANALFIGAVFARTGPFREFSKDQALLAALAHTVINISLYQAPGVLLASTSSMAISLSASLWIMGLVVYTTNRWSQVPAFLNAMMLPCVIAMIIGFYQITSVVPEASSPLEWAVAVACVVIFLISLFKTLHENTQVVASLSEARATAAARLAALEDSQRHDFLTGLLNRPAFDRALFVMLQDRTFGDGEVAVFLIDLDGFKPINDTYSHDAGDAVLVETARRLQDTIANHGIIGRLGGDEYICAISNVADLPFAESRARALARAIAEPIEWNGRKLKISASIGYATTTPDDAGTLETVTSLCSAADQAMFAAKSSPNGAPILYRPHLFAPRMCAADRQLLVEGIATKAIRPFYQPKFHLKTGQIVGFEALARWEHPTDGIRRPGSFLAQIAELGLQGDFMVSQAQQVVDDIETMLGAGLDPGQVSLNVSEVALATHSGRQDLHRIVASSPDAARHLTLEITEDVFIARAADTIQASIATFRALGVRISLDDFGTGFASFHHLRQLDFDELKIDTSFVEGLGHDSTSEVLVNGFLTIASGLGVGVVAEGVETDAQSRDLQNMGCMIAQGYLFSTAIPLDGAMDLLERQQAA